VDPFEELAESRIREAEARGEFDHLPGAGRPQRLEEDAVVPQELRMAYRVLKNANCLPPDLVQRREIRSLEELIDALSESAEDEPDALRDAHRRLTALRCEVESRRGPSSPLWADPRYQERLLRRFDRNGQ